VTDVTGCTNYAQGGSRVKDADGTNHSFGAATESVTVQIEKFLALAPNSKFKGTELVTVQGGANDMFAQARILTEGATTAGAGAFGAALQAGKTMDEATAAGAAAAAAYASGAGAYSAVNNMSTAGKDLADAVKLVIASGAKKVVVMNIPDASQAPGTSSEARPLTLAMLNAFNSKLKSELTGVNSVLLLDVFAENQKQFLNPTQFGLTNVKTAACTTSASICNPTNVIPGDISHYLFADDVHPTAYGHKLLSQFVNKELVLAGWL
jgi:phospholipase/lecithinase/hemolysin